MRKNRLRELFAADIPAYAGWMSFDSAYAAELVGSSGFDAVVIDGQHGMAGFETQLRMLQALSHTPAVPLVRVAQNSLAEVNRALDAGAYGVICPLVNTAGEAASFARACRYPLDGMAGDRSMGPARGLLYGGADYPQHANAEILALAMIETRPLGRRSQDRQTADRWTWAGTAAVRRVDVPLDGLPPALHGFTIVQISDVHVGPTVKREFVQRIVNAVNRLRPDAVAVTGNLVDGRVRDLQGDVEPLAALRSRHGTFFVTGNHEYDSGVAEWTAALRSLGLKVLDNEHVVIDHDGAQLAMAGVFG